MRGVRLSFLGERLADDCSFVDNKPDYRKRRALVWFNVEMTACDSSLCCRQTPSRAVASSGVAAKWPHARGKRLRGSRMYLYAKTRTLYIEKVRFLCCSAGSLGFCILGFCMLVLFFTSLMSRWVWEESTFAAPPLCSLPSILVFIWARFSAFFCVTRYESGTSSPCFGETASHRRSMISRFVLFLSRCEICEEETGVFVLSISTRILLKYLLCDKCLHLPADIRQKTDPPQMAITLRHYSLE